MNLNFPRINVVFVVRDEWPLLAISITHALLNYASKAIIVDTGSKDGTYSGINKLKQIFPERIDFYICPQKIFDQASLVNIAMFLSEEDGADWTVILDADEFFYCHDFEKFKTHLSHTSSNLIGFAIPVIDYAPFANFNESILDDFLNIKARVEGIPLSQATKLDYMNQVLAGEILLQQKVTPDKLVLRNGPESFISQGNHQLVFGDGIYWTRWDSRVASGSNVGFNILHLPYTTLERLEKRYGREFYDGEKTISRLSGFHDKSLSRQLYESASISEKNSRVLEDAGKIKYDDVFSNNLGSTIWKLDEFWPLLSSLKFSLDDRDACESRLDFNVVSKIVRKMYNKSMQLWETKMKVT